jgi:hypothetical protein
MSDIVQKVQSKKEKIARLQTQLAKQEGRKEEILRQLQAKFNVSSLEEGKKELNNLIDTITQNETRIEEIDDNLQKIISSATPKTTKEG